MKRSFLSSAIIVKKPRALTRTLATGLGLFFALTAQYTCGNYSDVVETGTASEVVTEESDTPQIRDLFSDTWFAVDALDRTMPTFDEVGPVKNDQRRVVGIFYITWHTQNHAKQPNPYTSDVTKILAEAPEARLDAKHPAWRNSWSLHWGEPETGYFLSQDEYVIRKDMSELVDAGIDVIILDVTNAVLYWDEWEVLFNTMEKMKAEGNQVPKFCFWSFNGDSITVVQKLYEAYYKTRRFEDLWFYWDGKPLLLYNSTPDVDANGVDRKSANIHYDPDAKTNKDNPHFGDPEYTEEYYTDYTKDVKEFFTLRCMWWGYYKWNGKRYIGTEDNWSFGYDLGNKDVQKLKPEELVSLHNGAREEAAVTPAQHPASLIGKSWTRKSGEPELDEYDLPKSAYVPWLGKVVEHPEAYGIYYQDRWDEALAVNPQFLYLNDWNEWTAGRYTTPETLHALNFMRRGKEAQYFFVDQYNAEFNRCIQPMKGGYTDNYYMQTVNNIRKYKGVRPTPVNLGYVSASDGSAQTALNLWDSISVEYRDTVGDVAHRDAVGYGGERYVDVTGRNDFTTCKVGVDKNNLYFFAETAENWTPSTDPNWALLFVNSDQDYSNGWYGYDFLINKNVVNDAETTLCRWNGKEWEEIAKLSYAVKDRRLVVVVPRKLLNASGEKIEFDYKWSDNATELVDPISLCTAGDAAPNRRFNYRFVWKMN
ncbi:MAG: hypothetical protein IK077_15660 [Thermoguttaceae bacterium]|nr:hypothetical protein [Thermoguttaceae bacterium]